MPKPVSDKARAARLNWGARLKAYNEEAKLVRGGFVDLRCTGFRDLVASSVGGFKRLSGVATFNDQVKRRFRFDSDGLTLFTPDAAVEAAMSSRLVELQGMLDIHWRFR